MAIKKIVFLFESFLNTSEYERMGIDILISNGFDVEVWSIIKITRPLVTEDSLGIVNPMYEYEGYKVFDSINKLYYSLICEKTSTVYITYYTIRKNELNLPSKWFQIFAFLKLTKKRYSVITAYAVPRKLQVEIRSSITKNLFKLIYSPEYHFFGSVSDKRDCFMVKKTKKFFIHSTDYDKIIRTMNISTSEDFIVLYDGNYFFHTDFKTFSSANHLKDLKGYYTSLCRFLDFIEDKYKTDIIIAAHPKVDYSNKKNYFGGRKIVYNKTAELTKCAKFVITPASTAINIAVALEKPIVAYFTNEELKISDHSANIKNFSKALNKKFININKDYSNIDFDENLRIDEKVYSRYKKEYVKRPNTPEKMFFQVVSDIFKEENK